DQSFQRDAESSRLNPRLIIPKQYINNFPYDIKLAVAKRMRFYDLRHTYTTIMLKNRINH
ncbi:hypothetical protein MOB66_22240, partial [Bacillus haynesii]|nr:hypothetical protein [Bacillus haynesii]